jgi:RimJ/RimL family protein N-acetyltransferase
VAALDLPTIVTGELTLRPWTAADAPALVEACGDEGICRFTTVPRRYSPEAAGEWLRRQAAHATAGSGIVLALVPAAEAQPVGMIGLFGLDQHERAARLGYWLIARARGRGLATAGACALARWGFETLALETIYIDREPENAASARVAAKLGTDPVGAREVRLRDGRSVSLIRHALRAAP